MCKNSLHHTNAIFGMISIRFLSGLYTKANTESYKGIADKDRGVQEGKYFTVLTGSIFDGIKQSMRFY